MGACVRAAGPGIEGFGCARVHPHEQPEVGVMPIIATRCATRAARCTRAQARGEDGEESLLTLPVPTDCPYRMICFCASTPCNIRHRVRTRTDRICCSIVLHRNSHTIRPRLVLVGASPVP
eukprot:1152143-Prorocentrum_minimum.AAC.1